MQGVRTTPNVAKGHINGGRDLGRLLALQLQRKRNVASAITWRLRLQRLVKRLKMDYGCSGCTTYGGDISGEARINVNRRESARSVVR